jgi:hypothetical protein
LEVYEQFSILAMDAGGKPITVPDVIPKRTQKAIAAAVEPALVHKATMRIAEMNCAAICMFKGPVLSEKAAMVSRPTVEAPFMMVRSQNVWSGLLSEFAMCTGTREPSRVP